MHRLGTLAHLPSLALAPSLSATPSNITLASHMAPPSGAGPSTAAALAAESPWASLHVLILPLFNEEPLRVPIEDINQLVRRHISTVVSAAPGKAFATLEHDTRELISAGMVTLNSKLAGVSDENLVPRVVELWSSFWTQVLPYLEGALLPLQTEEILVKLHRNPKPQRPSSPTSAQNGKGIGASVLLPSSGSTQLGVRALALALFRDRIVLPLFPRLNALLTLFKDEHPSSTEPHQPRLQQMLLVLVSQRSQRLVSLSLTAPPPQPTAGEAAITRLLRAMHAPLATLARGGPARATTTGAPSFLSAGLPRDRRGRIGARGSTATATTGAAELDARGRWRLREDMEGEGEDEGTWGVGTVYAETPRGGVSFADPERERDKELLESLRSPDPEGGAGSGAARAGMGGWGLDGGREEDEYEYEHDYEDEDEIVEEPEENLDWDAAQSIVERMVGIKNDSLPPTPSAHQQQQQPPPPPPPHQQQPQPDPRRRMI
ncbi:hypothetical protein TRAPUB_14049 [Trametes pubescens]|uniref:Target of rapamycin complex 2 subunit bit61 n=1 Tax=Trametes pubescens TaxID=154538 RepID=A0A1M2VPD5_TRAPU|nr:hypothetical protein TRAPUB_14049 [Trametes pubescens]